MTEAAGSPQLVSWIGLYEILSNELKGLAKESIDYLAQVHAYEKT